MFIARSEDLDHIFTGVEIQSQVDEPNHSTFKQGFRCPICGQNVTYSHSSLNRPFEYFTHVNNREDCFSDDSMSDEHRLAEEITVKTLYNRLEEVTGVQPEIDVEKRIGTSSDFVITDVRVRSPLRITAEVFYKSERLGLKRRLTTLFKHNYQTYLIFHTDGKHDVDRIEQTIKCISPLRIGRFHPEILDLSLGDLFNERQIDLHSPDKDSLPNYII